MNCKFFHKMFPVSAPSLFYPQNVYSTYYANDGNLHAVSSYLYGGLYGTVSLWPEFYIIKWIFQWGLWNIEKGFVIQFEDFSFGKVKLKTTQDGIFMIILNFDWLFLFEIMTGEVRNVKKEQSQKRDHSRLQAKHQRKSDDSSGTQREFYNIKWILIFSYAIVNLNAFYTTQFYLVTTVTEW